MSIAPIVRSVIVKGAPDRAFALFTGHIGTWWPHGKTPAAQPHVAIVIEPHAGGAWFERDAAGTVTPWGKVLAWEPPTRLLLGWQLNSRFVYDPAFLTEVELTFEATAEGGTKVTLEHRNLERFGADAAKFAGQLDAGWPKFLADFGRFVDTQR